MSPKKKKKKDPDFKTDGITESIKYVIPPLKKRIELIVQSIKKLFSNN